MGAPQRGDVATVYSTIEVRSKGKQDRQDMDFLHSLSILFHFLFRGGQGC